MLDRLKLENSNLPFLADGGFSMKRSKFTESQITFILRQAEEGTPITEVCRKAGISEATFYNWRHKYGGLLPSEMKRLRQLEEENGKLKKLVADLSLDKVMLQDVIRRNVWSAPSVQGFWISKRAQSA
jgi:putative transposase